jgi:hypothetical protein
MVYFYYTKVADIKFPSRELVAAVSALRPAVAASAKGLVSAAALAQADH